MATGDTRSRILHAALACFLEFGYERTSTVTIRERAGVSNGSLFHHFSSKKAIADALHVQGIADFQHGVWEILRSRPTSLPATVRAVIEHQLGWVEANSAEARFIYSRDRLPVGSPAGDDLASLNRQLADELRELLGSLTGEGDVTRVPVSLIAAVVMGPGHALARRWLAGGLDRPLSSYSGELALAALSGLRALARAPAESTATANSAER